jgi:arabinofuranosyltransferase
VDSATLTTSRRRLTGARAMRVLVLLLLLAALIKAAWVCDDAFITMRTVDNLLHGRGLTWNPGERVQVFTHPLWLGVLTLCDLLSPDGYWTALLSGLAVSVAMLALLLWAVPGRRSAIAAAGLALVLSRAQVDFATSGLENPLACLLVVLLLRCDLRDRADGRPVPGPGMAAVRRRDAWLPPDGDAARLLALGLLTSLLALTRLDLVLVPLPVLAARVVGGGWRHWRQLLLAAAPLVLWEIFAVVYFGFPLPNTAYAKLGTGISAFDLMRRGTWYFAATFRRDPLTLAVIAGGLAWALVRGDRTRRLWAVGVLLYLVYVVRIGGDFMMGRFFVVPLVAVIALTAPLLPAGRRGWLVPAALALGLLAPRNPVTCPVMPREEYWFRGIADERGYYYSGTGLVPRLRPGFVEHEYIRAGREARALMQAKGQAFNTVECIGFFGYYAGPRLYLIDVMALADPFLARLPVSKPTDPRSWRIGHFTRDLPPGYRETIAGDRNVIRDPQLARLYDELRLITSGPLWSADRWRAIWRLNLRRGSGS